MDIQFVSITIGNAVAVLAFTFAIEQFLRPIHRFRMRARRMSRLWFYILVFGGAALVFAGNVTRMLFSMNEIAVSSASVAEVVGGLLFLTAYIGVAFISLNPARLTKRNAPQFARAAFDLLSSATDDDYVKLFRDITYNVQPLFKVANFNDVYRRRFRTEEADPAP